ncbi:MAG: hypothetical protein LBU60_02405 [Clostridiales bacterium]|jgi:hypothetical protein|nr:hypothetical protein [Clostridiales bacterium]
MLIALCIVLFILSLLTYPLHFHIEGELDVFVNGGHIKLYFFGVRIFRAKLLLEQDEDINSVYLQSYKSQKILTKIHLTADVKDKNSILSIMTGSVLSNLNVTDFFLSCEIGRKSDAIFTAVGLTMMRMAYCAFMSFVKSWQKIRTQETFVPLYDKNIFFVEFLGIFTFNLADIIYGVVLQFAKRFVRFEPIIYTRQARNIIKRRKKLIQNAKRKLQKSVSAKN